MLTPKQSRVGLAATRCFPTGPKPCWQSVGLWLAALALMATACNKDVATQAIDADANGYLCLKCGAKLYTARTVFIGPQCPKCQQESLIDVIGYYCKQDNHLTIRPSRGDTQPVVCDVCKTPVVKAMRLPHERDLKAWGATKTSS